MSPSRGRFAALVGVLLSVLATGCGSVSGFRSGTTMPSLAGYSRVVVNDFTNQAHFPGTDPAKRQGYEDQLAIAGRTFADWIAAELRTTGAFAEVSRTPIEDKAAVVSGIITRYHEGSAAMRFLVGLGAGSSYFDADVMVTDGQDRHTIGTFLVDKNSWFLGGGVAATQTPETFMRGAAKKIAKDLAAATRRPAPGTLVAER